MKLIDIGANLSNIQFKDDISIVLDKARLNFVDKIILTTTDTESFLINIKNCNIYSNYLHTTWGLHPHKAKYLQNFINDTMVTFISNPNKIVAIGEFGLDYFRMFSSAIEQINSMNYFLDFSKNYNFPLFMHERNAHNLFCSLYKEHNINNKSVIHCFTGNHEELKNYLDLGLYIGITGWICDNRRNSDLISCLNYIPNDRLMIETDSPFLKPRHIKCKTIRNEPAFLFFILEELSKLKKIPIEKLSNIIYNNTCKFFKI